MIALAAALVTSLHLALAGGSLECDLRKCNLANIQYYLELDCRPIREPGICCPHSFDCSDMLSQWQKRNKYKCYFKNHVYDLGARPSLEELYGPCLSDCVCFYNSTRSYVKCSEKRCPESRQAPLAKGCVRQYFTDSCCSTGVICALNSTSGRQGFGFTCKNGNSSFLEGEIFSPVEHPCKRCMCQRGYNGSITEPWCVDIYCGMELHYPEYIARGCAPIYDAEHHCCPNGWRCPTEEDRVTGVAEIKWTKDNRIIQPRLCRFGALKLSVGQNLLFTPTLPYHCSCVTPPVLSCIRLAPLKSTHPPGYMELTARPFDPCSDVKCRPGERCISLVPWHTKCV